MFLKIRLLFKKYDVTLWVKELWNVAHTIFLVSIFHMNLFLNEKFLLWGQYLKNVKVRFGNAKNSSVFEGKCLLISRLLGRDGSKL